MPPWQANIGFSANLTQLRSRQATYRATYRCSHLWERFTESGCEWHKCRKERKRESIVKHTIVLLTGCTALSGGLFTYSTVTVRPMTVPAGSEPNSETALDANSSPTAPTTPVLPSSPAVALTATPVSPPVLTWPHSKDVLTPIGPRRFELKRSTLATLRALCTPRDEAAPRIRPDHGKPRQLQTSCRHPDLDGWCMPDRLPELIRAIGLRPRDCIFAINGFDLSVPSDALQLYHSQPFKLALAVNKPAPRLYHVYLVD